MDDNLNKLILKNNFAVLKKKETLNSVQNNRRYKNSADNKQFSNKNSSINYQHIPISEKNKLNFKSYIKKYGITHIDLGKNSVKRFPKTPKNFNIKVNIGDWKLGTIPIYLFHPLNNYS